MKHKITEQKLGRDNFFHIDLMTNKTVMVLSVRNKAMVRKGTDEWKTHGLRCTSGVTGEHKKAMSRRLGVRGRWGEMGGDRYLGSVHGKRIL